MNANRTMEAALGEDRRDGDRVPYAARVMIVRAESAWFAQLLDLFLDAGVFMGQDAAFRQLRLQRQDALLQLLFAQQAGWQRVLVHQGTLLRAASRFVVRSHAILISPS